MVKLQLFNMRAKRNMTLMMCIMLLSASGNAGSIYTRWGRSTCPSTSELVYEGIVGNSYYTEIGGGSNYLCLPQDPDNLEVDAGRAGVRAFVYSAEYETSSFTPLAHLHDHGVPCAVCKVTGRGAVLMIPAKTRCPTYWVKEYTGYLMSAYYGHVHQTEFVCVDKNAEEVPGTHVSTNGALLYPVEARCDIGDLPCLPYVNGNEMACVVCTV